jgi:hypothetical protein
MDINAPAPGSSVPKRITAIAAGILLSLGVFVALSGDFSQTPSTTSATTDLATTSATTDLGATDADWNCTDVMDWNFYGSKILQNNLGGKGPNLKDKQEIRYGSVYTKGNVKADLVVTTVGPYVPKTTAHNGLNGLFGVINIKSNTAAQFKFQLVQEGTETPIDIGSDEKILFSVYDLDNGKKTNQHEYVKFTTPVASHAVTTPTTVQVSGNDGDGTLYAQSGRYGEGSDNPANPLEMTQIAEESKVSVTYVGKASWTIVFGDKNDAGGRNVLFAGRSQGDCACIGVSDWTLHGNLKYDNLGGKGPATADPPELRFTKVFEAGWAKQPVDLVIKVADGSTYDPANTALNGLWPTPTPDHTQMAQVNVRCGTETTFEFSFVQTGTDTPAALSNTFFSVYDLDQPKSKPGKPGGHEYAIFTTPPTAYKLTPNTEVMANGTMADGTLQFTSTQWGVLSDNPTNPRDLTSLQQSRSVTVWYSDASKFQVTLGSTCPDAKYGRNMLFAGPGIYCRKPGAIN